MSYYICMTDDITAKFEKKNTLKTVLTGLFAKGFDIHPFTMKAKIQITKRRLSYILQDHDFGEK